MSPVVIAAAVALFLYLALRVVQMKRKSLPFLVAYPLFVAILVGGGIAAFVGASYAAVAWVRGIDEAFVLAGVFAVTGVCLLPLWWLARRAIG
jgi:hypothetical protein